MNAHFIGLDGGGCDLYIINLFHIYDIFYIYLQTKYYDIT